jgi:hypothetical protein
MNEESKPGPHRPRWISSLVVLVVTSIVLTAALELAAFLGAKTFVDGVTTDTDAALHNLTPLEMGRRYSDILSDRLVGACRTVPYDQVRACFAAHPTPTGFNMIWPLTRALFSLIRQIFGESPVHFIVDSMQLIAGFLALFFVMASLKILQYVFLPQFMIAVIPLGILFSCLLSLPLLWLLHFVATVIGGILPQAGASVVGGVWAGFIFECSGRTVEGGLHHTVAGAVERILPRM